MSSLNRIVKYAIPILLFLIVIAISANLLINHDTVIPPHIVLQKTATTLPSPIYSFPFGNTTVTITSPVDPSVYAGAKAAAKETIIRGNVSDDIWLRATYFSMINDPNQESFYTDLIHDMRAIRDEQGLDEDEYLELMTVFVQSVRYETISENPPKFPIETYVEKSGDCDDKSLLLAGLLSREGYNVSLILFTPESHMAVGVVCPGGEYKQTGYAYVETTNLSFAGVPTDTLGDGIQLRSDPFVIPVGNGTKIYGMCGEGLYINSVYQTSEQKVDDLTVQIDSMKTVMDGLYLKRDVNNYNLRVPLYNNLQRQRLEYAELHNYILDHQYDRKGTYKYVKMNLPG